MPQTGEIVKVLPQDLAIPKSARGTGTVIGTPMYMSPEQAKGEQVDGRSDLYSLGMVMYEMLTGDLPLKGDTTIEFLLAHIRTPPRPIREIRPGLQISDGIANLVMQCLEKDPSRRPVSARVLIDKIERTEMDRTDKLNHRLTLLRA